MSDTLDCFTGRVLCSRPECQWVTPSGTSGIEARYRDQRGAAVCFEHRPKSQTVAPAILVRR